MMYDEEANKGSCNMRESKRNRRLSDAVLSLMSARSATAEARDRYEEGTAASNELMKASDYLSSEARLGVALGNVTHMNNSSRHAMRTSRCSSQTWTCLKT